MEQEFMCADNWLALLTPCPFIPRDMHSPQVAEDFSVLVIISNLIDEHFPFLSFDDCTNAARALPSCTVSCHFGSRNAKPLRTKRSPCEGPLAQLLIEVEKVEGTFRRSHAGSERFQILRNVSHFVF